jgi:histidine ammonia-lyase
MAAAQGIDLRRPLATSPRLLRAQAAVRERTAFLDNDRLLSGDIAALAGLVLNGWFSADFLGSDWLTENL